MDTLPLTTDASDDAIQVVLQTYTMEYRNLSASAADHYMYPNVTKAQLTMNLSLPAHAGRFTKLILDHSDIYYAIAVF